MDETTEKLTQLIARLFRCEVSDLNDGTGPGDVPGWDSLGHVTLMVEIQKQFGSHVPLEDAIEVESIADLAGILRRLHGTDV